MANWRKTVSTAALAALAGFGLACAGNKAAEREDPAAGGAAEQGVESSENGSGQVIYEDDAAATEQDATGTEGTGGSGDAEINEDVENDEQSEETTTPGEAGTLGTGSGGTGVGGSGDDPTQGGDTTSDGEPATGVDEDSTNTDDSLEPETDSGK